MTTTSLSPRNVTAIHVSLTRLAAAIGTLLAALFYLFSVRRWFNQWGTTPDERTRAMPGDELISSPTNRAMQAITVEARPEDIWPWLVQIGYQRGGMYSYDWLDRLFGFLDRPSSNTILPEFQQLAVGDMIPWGHGDFLTVKAIEPNHALVLELNAHGMDWVWQFGLYPVDVNRTRLVTRGIERTPTSIAWRLGMLATEPAAFIMTTRMLFGVKRRAEALRRSRAE
jgi:hypothetical protein